MQHTIAADGARTLNFSPGGEIATLPCAREEGAVLVTHYTVGELMARLKKCDSSLRVMFALHNGTAVLCLPHAVVEPLTPLRVEADGQLVFRRG